MFTGNIFDELEDEQSLDELLLRHEEERYIFWNSLKEEALNEMDDEGDM